MKFIHETVQIWEKIYTLFMRLAHAISEVYSAELNIASLVYGEVFLRVL